MSKNKTRFELNRQGVRELMRSKEMEEIVSNHAKSAQTRLGSGYSTDTYTGNNRVNAMVFAETAEAQKDNLENNSLLKKVHR